MCFLRAPVRPFIQVPTQETSFSEPVETTAVVVAGTTGTTQQASSAAVVKQARRASNPMNPFKNAVQAKPATGKPVAAPRGAAKGADATKPVAAA